MPLTYSEFCAAVAEVTHPKTTFTATQDSEQVFSLCCDLDVENAEFNPPHDDQKDVTVTVEVSFLGPVLTRADVHRAQFELLMSLLRHEAGHFFTVGGQAIFDEHRIGSADGDAVYIRMIGGRLAEREEDYLASDGPTAADRDVTKHWRTRDQMPKPSEPEVVPLGLSWHDFCRVVSSCRHPNVALNVSRPLNDILDIFKIDFHTCVPDATSEAGTAVPMIPVGTTAAYYGPGISEYDVRHSIFEHVVAIARHEAGHFFLVDGDPLFDGHRNDDRDATDVYNFLIGTRLDAQRDRSMAESEREAHRRRVQPRPWPPCRLLNG